MFNVGGGEVLVILLIALIVLGPDKLPNAAKQAGKYLGDFRRMSGGFKKELKDAMDMSGLSEITDLAKPSSQTKAKSVGGPTPRPAVPATPAVTPSSDAGPTANGSASTNGTSESNGQSDGSAPAVRKRSIEVDGPSSSFG